MDKSNIINLHNLYKLCLVVPNGGFCPCYSIGFKGYTTPMTCHLFWPWPWVELEELAHISIPLFFKGKNYPYDVPSLLALAICGTSVSYVTAKMRTIPFRGKVWKWLLKYEVSFPWSTKKYLFYFWVLLHKSGSSYRNFDCSAQFMCRWIFLD